MSDQLGANYIFSMKPNPADPARGGFDKEKVRSILRRDMRTTPTCRSEVIMKDNHTLRNDPRCVIRWLQIAREEAESV